MIGEPTCFTRQCKWYVGVIQPDGTEATETHFCGAFPDGIPKEIAYGKNKHSKVIEGQAKPYTYQKSRDWEHHFKGLPPEDAVLWQTINAEGIARHNTLIEKQEQENQKLNTLRGLALDLVNGRQWQKARLIGEYLTGITPEEPMALMLLGIACLESGDLGKAEELFLRSMELDPEKKVTQNFLFMARLCSRRGDFEGQLQWATQAKKGDDPEAFFVIADAYQRLGKWNDAVATLREIIERHPENVKARSMLGRVYLSLGKLDKAADEFRTALDLESDDASLWADLGCVVKRLKHYRGALEAFLQAANLEPENPLRHYDVGDTYLSLGEHDKAIAFLAKAIQLNPDFVLAHYDLGLAFLLSGKYQECAQESEAALRHDPDMETQQTNLGIGAINNLAVAYLYQEKYREAEEVQRRNLKLFATTYYNLGLALFKQKRFEESLPNFQQAVELALEDPEYLDLLGNAYGELGMLQEAEESLRRSIKRDKKYAVAHYDLGCTLAKTKGREQEALKSFKRAIALEEDLPWAYYSIACIHALQGKKIAALELLEKALEKGLKDRTHIDNDSDLDSLRNDPKFRGLMERYFKDF